MTRGDWLEEIERGCLDTCDECWDRFRRCERSLKWHGLYERYLLCLYGDMGCGELSPTQVKAAFAKANRKRLLVAGDPIPVKKKTVTLFRGVSGKGEIRNIRGMSWTDDLNIACHFATRWSRSRNPETWDWARDPAVFRVTVSMKNVLCYMDGRKGEREYVLDAAKLPESARVEFHEGELQVRAHFWRYDGHYKMYSDVLDPERVLADMGYVPTPAEGDGSACSIP
jgi:hypothetical protein